MGTEREVKKDNTLWIILGVAIGLCSVIVGVFMYFVWWRGGIPYSTDPEAWAYFATYFGNMATPILTVGAIGVAYRQLKQAALNSYEQKINIEQERHYESIMNDLANSEANILRRITFIREQYQKLASLDNNGNVITLIKKSINKYYDNEDGYLEPLIIEYVTDIALNLMSIKATLKALKYTTDSARTNPSEIAKIIIESRLESIEFETNTNIKRYDSTLKFLKEKAIEIESQTTTNRTKMASDILFELVDS